MRISIYIRLLLLVSLAAAVGGCGEDKSADNDKPKIPAVNVNVIEAVPHESLVESFVLHAKVEPNRIVNLSAEVAGRIEKIFCEEGCPIDEKHLSEPIIMIKDDLIKAEYDQAEAQARFDKLEFERLKQLFERQVATASELDKARTTAEASAAELQRRKGRLDRTRIYPSITGTLNSIPVELGEYVAEGTVVAEIVDSQVAKIVADVPERDIQFLSVGDPVTLIYSYKGEPSQQDAKISLIDKLSHPQALTTSIVIAVDNSDGKFLNGQVLRVMFTRRIIKNAIMVPMEIVIPLEDAKAVYVVEGNKAVRREVELGFIRGREVQITKGLKAGDMVIIKGQRYVSNGRDVKVTAE